MTRRARKVLDVIRASDRPLFWHEAGVIAYPRSTRWRHNILGKPFLDLVGSGLSATHAAILELEAAGLVTKGTDHRYIAARRAGRAK